MIVTHPPEDREMIRPARRTGYDELDSTGDFLPADVEPKRVSSTEGLILGVPETRKPYRRVIFVTLAMFSGYAATVTLQSKLRSHMGIDADPSTGTPADQARSRMFNFAVTCQYVGNLIFRLGHNLFWCIGARERVGVSQCCMIGSMSIIMAIFVLNWQSVEWVVLASLLSGMGIGCFESNLMASIATLGPQTKFWAIVGLPLGFNVVSIGGYGFMSVGMDPVCVYAYVFLANLIAIVVFFRCLPLPTCECVGGVATPQSTGSVDREEALLEDRNGGGRRNTPWQDLSHSMRHFSDWFFRVLPHSLALMIDMFCVAICTSLSQNVFAGKYVPLWNDDGKRYLVRHDLYFAVLNFGIFLGDTLSRRFAYAIRFRATLRGQMFLLLGFLTCNIVGLGLLVSKRGLPVMLGSFLIFFGNGTIYATTTRFVDSQFGSVFHLAALSIWLFIGDVGSVTGGNLMLNIREAICPKGPEYHYTCIDHTVFEIRVPPALFMESSNGITSEDALFRHDWTLAPPAVDHDGGTSASSGFMLAPRSASATANKTVSRNAFRNRRSSAGGDVVTLNVPPSLTIVDGWGSSLLNNLLTRPKPLALGAPDKPGESGLHANFNPSTDPSSPMEEQL